MTDVPRYPRPNHAARTRATSSAGRRYPAQRSWPHARSTGRPRFARPGGSGGAWRTYVL